MNILRKATLKDGVKIRIEDWSKDFRFHNYGDLLSTYPIATKGGKFYPKNGEEYRLTFLFVDNKKANEVFDKLLSGDLKITDLKQYAESEEMFDAM